MPDDLGDHAAAIDIADQHDRRIRRARKTHIGDVALPQIDFGRTAGAFDQHEIGLGFHMRETLEHRRHQLRLPALIFARFGVADDAALHDDLRADLALRLQQDRVHVDARRGRGRRAPAAPARGRSRRRPAVTAALFDMFCGLNGRTFRPREREGAAEPGDDQRLADVGARALEHQRARHL